MFSHLVSARTLACAGVLAAAPIVTAAAQAPSLRVSPRAVQSSISRVARTRLDEAQQRELRRGMSPAAKGAVIGGAIGLGASLLVALLYVESTDAGNRSGTGRVVVIGTALGAVIGAAIGAGRE